MSVDEALKYIISMGVVAPRGAVAPLPPRTRRARRCADAAAPPEIDRARRRAVARRALRRAPRCPPDPLASRTPTQRSPENALKRTDYCGRIDRRHLGQTVTLMGWVHRRRDHGGVIFVDLRDREGLVQIVFDPDRAATFAHGRNAAQRIRASASPGSCACGPKARVNPNLVSGEIEVLAHEIEILNAAQTPPFQLDDENLSETVRLEHRVHRPAPPADAEEPDAAPPRGDGGAPLPRRARLRRHRDAGALQVDAGGRARVPRAVADPPRPCSTRCRSRRSSSSRC